MKEKQAIRISEDTWKQQGKEFYHEDFPGRKCANIYVGIDVEGDEKYFITEPFFLDILPKIFSHEIKVHVNLYADPQIVCELNGRLVAHNGDIPVIKEDLDSIIDITTESNRIRSLAEIRSNFYMASKLGITTKILRDQLTEALPKGVLLDGKKLNYEFLKLYLRDRYRLNEAPTDNLQKIIRDMSKEELCLLQGGIIEKIKTGFNTFEPAKSLIEEYGIEEVETVYKEELSHRFFLGDIR